MAEDIIVENSETLPLVNTSGQDLIDATQNAIMGAAENVSEIISVGKNAAAEVHEAPFYMEVEFWVAMAFVLSVLVLAKPLFGFIRKGLQRRIDKVVQNIEDAAKLRDDAQVLLADYERKFVNAQSEAARIIEQSKKNMQNLKRHELSKLKTELQNKETEAERRIAAATEKAKAEINLSASRTSIELAKQAINHYLQTNDKSKLIDEAIADLGRFTNHA